jgi:cell division protein FtsL
VKRIKSMKRPLFIIGSMLFIIVVLSVVRVASTNSISTTGIELASLEEETNKYKKENELLKEKYLQASSLTNIEEKAKKLGFVESKTTVYLSEPLPLARR